MSLFLSDKIKDSNKQAFEYKVIAISDQLGIFPNWLMIVMYFESRLNPKAVNSTTGATGLIQFMPATAKGLGTTVEDLKQMDGFTQLNYVYKYLLPYKGKINSLTDLYLTVFYPYAVGKEDNYILGSQNGTQTQIYNANKIFDTNKDGVISKQEIENYIVNFAKKNGYDVFTNQIKKKRL